MKWSATEESSKEALALGLGLRSRASDGLCALHRLGFFLILGAAADHRVVGNLACGGRFDLFGHALTRLDAGVSVIRELAGERIVCIRDLLDRAEVTFGFSSGCESDLETFIEGQGWREHACELCKRE